MIQKNAVLKCIDNFTFATQSDAFPFIVTYDKVIAIIAGQIIKPDRPLPYSVSTCHLILELQIHHLTQRWYQHK
jgi:hypothetical protein